MTTLTTKARDALPTNAFAIPSKAPGSGSYPINDPNHARNALSRVAQNGSPAEKDKVRQAVARKYPGIGDKENKAESGRGDEHEPKRSPNPHTARHGHPVMTGRGERQLDGNRTPTFSQPVKHGGLADRAPAPNRSSGGSGMEHAMGALADQLHQPRRRGR